VQRATILIQFKKVKISNWYKFFLKYVNNHKEWIFNKLKYNIVLGNDLNI